MKVFEQKKLPEVIQTIIGRLQDFVKDGSSKLPAIYIATNGNLVLDFVEPVVETKNEWNALFKTIPNGIAGEPILLFDFSND